MAPELDSGPLVGARPAAGPSGQRGRSSLWEALRAVLRRAALAVQVAGLVLAVLGCLVALGLVWSCAVLEAAVRRLRHGPAPPDDSQRWPM